MNFFASILIVLFVLGFISESMAQDYPVDPGLGFSTGPEIGAFMPDFSLSDQKGRVRNLSQLVGRKGAILNFFRSASW